MERYALRIAGAVPLGALLVLGAVLLGNHATARADTATSSPMISGITASTTQTSATVGWTTDVPTTGQVLFGTTTGYGASTTLETASSTAHSQNLSGLTSGTMYHFQIQATNASGTLATSSDQTFTTASSTTATTTASTTAPVISGITASTTQNGATITWNTDVPTTGQVLYGTNTFYGSSTTLETASSTAHSQALSGLLSGTLYHFKIQATSASGTMASSSDQTFTTGSSTATTSAPVVSNVAITPTQTGATITWTTDQPSGSQIQYGTNAFYGASTALDATLTTSHSQTISGLTPNTAYHFSIGGSNGGGMAIAVFDRTFTTQASSGGTGTSTGTTTQDLQNQINALWAAINSLQNQLNGLVSQVNALIAGGGTGTSTGSSTGSTGNTGSATVNPIGSVPPGGTIDLGGRNFGHEESVQITLNGALVAMAHADGGGNFTTGSLRAPSTPGTYTYTFRGLTSGITLTGTLTVTP